MAVIYSTAAKAARMEAVRALLAGGTLEIGTAEMAEVLVTLPLTASAGTVSGLVLTLDMGGAVAATGTGTAAAAVFRSEGGAVVISGLTVGTSAADVVLENVSIAPGQNVGLATFSLTHGTAD